MLARDNRPSRHPAETHAAARAACRKRRQDGALCRLRHAGAIRDRRAEGTPAYPRHRRPVRRLPHGPDRAAAQVRQARGRALALERLVPHDILALAPGRQRYALFTNEGRRHPRRPDGGQFRRPPVSGRQRRLQGGRRGASARASLGRLRDRAPRRPRAARAAGAEGGIGAGESLRRSAGDALHGRRPASTSAALDCFVSRSGYTGEDGFEISVPAEAGRRAGEASCLPKVPRCMPIGLGARDSPAAGSRALPLRPRHRHHDDPGRGRAGMVGAEEPPQRRRARRRHFPAPM